MELAKVENLLEKYFEGNTTLNEETKLHAYFANENVAPQFAMYQSLFTELDVARSEVSARTFQLPKQKRTIQTWWYSVAAMLIIAITVGGFALSQQNNGLTQEEKEAIATFKQTKEALDLFSKNFNKGAEELAVINQFTITTNKILK